RSVLAAGDEAPAVAAVRDAAHRASVTPDQEQFLACCGVPHPQGSIPGPVEDAPAVRAERHTADRAPPRRGEHDTALLIVRHLHRPIDAAADDAPAVGAIRNAAGLVRMAWQGEEALAQLGIPDVQGTVPVPADDTFPVGAASQATDMVVFVGEG